MNKWVRCSYTNRLPLTWLLPLYHSKVMHSHPPVTSALLRAGVDHDPALAGAATDSLNKGAISCARLRKVSFYQTRGPSTPLARDPVGARARFCCLRVGDAL